MSKYHIKREHCEIIGWHFAVYASHLIYPVAHCNTRADAEEYIAAHLFSD